MDADFDLPFPHYRCPSCGKDLPVGEARMTVTCADHTEKPDIAFDVRLATVKDRVAIETICDRAGRDGHRCMGRDVRRARVAEPHSRGGR